MALVKNYRSAQAALVRGQAIEEVSVDTVLEVLLLVSIGDVDAYVGVMEVVPI